MRQLERVRQRGSHRGMLVLGTGRTALLVSPWKEVARLPQTPEEQGQCPGEVPPLDMKVGLQQDASEPVCPPWQRWGSPASRPCTGSSVALSSPKQDSSPAACGSCDKVPLLNFGSRQHWKAVRWWGRRPRSPGLLKHAPANMLFKKLL